MVISDYSGTTFIEAAAEGEDVDLWMDERVHQLRSPRFTEDGEGPHIIVTVSGGLVQDVEDTDGPARVDVHDYDRGARTSDPDIQIDAEGKRYLPWPIGRTEIPLPEAAE